MSMTKNFYHDEICARSAQFAEFVETMELTDAEIAEQMSEMFADHQIAPDGYQEFVCELCGEVNTRDFPHSECCDRENCWYDLN